MQDGLAMVVFWCAVLMLGFTFAGYPLLMNFLGRLKSKPNPLPTPSRWPKVDCVLVVHNEAARIGTRIENLLSSDYPPERLHLIVVCDSCTDETAHIARKVGGIRTTVVEQTTRQGKAAGLNAGLAVANGEFVVFADARQQFAPDAVTRLVQHLLQPGVGAVSGNYSLLPPADNVGSGVDVYWRIEKMLRQAESRWDSTIGCTGAIYAIRCGLFEPIPPDTILDDVVIPMQIAVRGWRVDFAEEAKAWESMPVVAGREFHRKRRTLAGNYQMLFRYTRWLLPWQNRLWWELICHKYLRLVAPGALLALFMSNLWLARGSTFYAATMGGQLVFYCLAILGILFPKWRTKLLTLPAGFVFLNTTTLAGFWYYLRQGGRGGWGSHPPTQPHVQSAG